MTAIFPETGVPASDARNSLPNPSTVNCNTLWYSTSRCKPRFDPAAMNAMMSEFLNLVNKGEVAYDCNNFSNAELAVRYMIQRGIPRGTPMYGGPFDYTGALDPTLTRYNDYLTLTVVPTADNQGAVRFNVDGKGFAQVLRNDGLDLESQDLRANRPAILVYFQGYWFHAGLVASQTQKLLITGSVDIWIRTDGNDETGDGSANTADKAFRTISGAWYRVGSRYVSTPLFTINLRLGIPGDYEGGKVDNFGGGVNLIGDVANKAAYRLLSTEHSSNPNLWSALSCSRVNMNVIGVTILRSVSTAPTVYGVFIGDNGNMEFWDVVFDTTAANASGSMIQAMGGHWIFKTDTYLYGRGTNIGSIIAMLYSAISGGVSVVDGTRVVSFDGFHCTGASFWLDNLSVQSWNATNMVSTDCTGSQYHVSTNSILNRNGQTMPGNAAGTIESGGQVT